MSPRSVSSVSSSSTGRDGIGMPAMHDPVADRADPFEQPALANFVDDQSQGCLHGDRAGAQLLIRRQLALRIQDLQAGSAVER